MKKFLILLLVTLAFPFAQAQEFHFMPKVGMSFANLTNSEGKMAPGLNIGVAAEFPVFDSFSIEPGVYYSMQGTRSSSYVGMGDMRVGGDVTFDMDYINIPIYAKYYVYEGFHLFAGPQFGFNVHSSVNVDARDFEGSGDDIDIKDAVNTFDFSIGIGAGYQFDMGLNIAINYNIGLTHAIKQGDFSDLGIDADEWEGWNDSFRNSVLQINLGYRF